MDVVQKKHQLSNSYCCDYYCIRCQKHKKKPSNVMSTSDCTFVKKESLLEISPGTICLRYCFDWLIYIFHRSYRLKFKTFYEIPVTMVQAMPNALWKTKLFMKNQSTWKICWLDCGTVRSKKSGIFGF